MGECEVCGAMNVGTRTVPMGRTTVSACHRCAERLGVGDRNVAPGLAQAARKSTPTRAKPNKGLMRRTERELAQDFGQRIRKARAGKGWSQEELARKMSEKVNVVKSSESGRRPTDGVISKFERVLNVVLMEEYTPEEHRQVGSGGGGGFTLGDYLNGAR